jgi:UV DNA damage endonuclease
MIEILKWNNANGITMYRMSSSMFPWNSEYDIEELPNYNTIKSLLKTAGDYATKVGQRLTFHPGPFNILASPNPKVVNDAVWELTQHGKVFDLMGLPRTHYAAMNIHVGGTYGDKDSAIKRFAENFKLLPECASSRLVLENDDKPSQYGVKDLYEIYKLCGTPITFDFFHHFCYEDSMPEKDALELCAKTWPKDIRQLCHYSSSKKLHEDSSVILRAHADYLYEYIETYGMDLDIEIEAKAKELALQKYHKDFSMIYS